MKLNKYSLIAAIVLGGVLTTSTFVKAEEGNKPAPGERKRGPDGPGGRNGEMRDLFAGLGLSNDQENKMQALQKELTAQIAALRENTSLSQEEKMAKMKAIGEERTAKMKTILTPDQLAKLEKMKGSNAGGPGGGMKGGMFQELGLSDDQKSKMEALNQEIGPKYKAIMENSSLSKEDKMAKMKALNEERMAKVKTILTPEQLAKLEKMKTGGGRPGGPGGPKGESKPKNSE